mgnify:CR=1 FL=1
MTEYASILENPAYWAAQEQVQFVVERRPKSWFFKRWQVRPKDATGVIHAGTRYQCLNIHQYLNMARSNGAWVALSPLPGTE